MKERLTLITFSLIYLLLPISFVDGIKQQTLHASEIKGSYDQNFPELNFENKGRDIREQGSSFQEIPSTVELRHGKKQGPYILRPTHMHPEILVTAQTHNPVYVKTIRPHQADFSNMDVADIYFDEERPFISNGVAQVLEKVVETLSEQEEERVRIEAHCDERGSSSYNLTLGETRGRDILRYFISRGVGAKQIDVISYGEEKPLCAEAGKICREANLRIQNAFPLLSISHSRNGCVTRILLKQRVPPNGQWVKAGHNPFIQQIHVAAPNSSAWTLSR